MFSLPNTLSLARIAMIPAIVAVLGYGWYLCAASLFVLAAITDTLDGYLARRNNSVSVLGSFLDLTADKLLICTILIVLAHSALLSPWIAIFLIGRELVVILIRMYAGVQGMFILPGSLGKVKMLALVVGVTTVLLGQQARLLEGYDSLPVPAIAEITTLVGYLTLLIACLLGLISGFDYFSKAAYLVANKASECASRTSD